MTRTGLQIDITDAHGFAADGAPGADVEALRARGIDLVGEVVDYADAYRLCYVRGPEGIIIMLAQEVEAPIFTDG